MNLICSHVDLFTENPNKINLILIRIRMGIKLQHIRNVFGKISIICSWNGKGKWPMWKHRDVIEEILDSWKVSQSVEIDLVIYCSSKAEHKTALYHSSIFLSGIARGFRTLVERSLNNFYLVFELDFSTYTFINLLFFFIYMYLFFVA